MAGSRFRDPEPPPEEPGEGERNERNQASSPTNQDPPRRRRAPANPSAARRAAAGPEEVAPSRRSTPAEQGDELTAEQGDEPTLAHRELSEVRRPSTSGRGARSSGRGARTAGVDKSGGAETPEEESNRQARLVQIIVPAVAVLLIVVVAVYARTSGDNANTANQEPASSNQIAAPTTGSAPRPDQSAQPETNGATETGSGRDAASSSNGGAASGDFSVDTSPDLPAPPPQGSGFTLPPRSTDSTGTANINRYDRIKEGMSLTEVRGVMGSPGTDSTSDDLRAKGASAYTWDGEKAGSSVTAVFENGRLTSKSQFGL